LHDFGHQELHPSSNPDPTYTLTIATWVTVIDLVLAAYVPAAYKEMGIS